MLVMKYHFHFLPSPAEESCSHLRLLWHQRLSLCPRDRGKLIAPRQCRSCILASITGTNLGESGQTHSTSPGALSSPTLHPSPCPQAETQVRRCYPALALSPLHG